MNGHRRDGGFCIELVAFGDVGFADVEEEVASITSSVIPVISGLYPGGSASTPIAVNSGRAS